MALVNYAAREINCKIVYYGTGLGGKTTNLKYIHGQLAPTTRGELISLATETERTLFFDFLPLDLGSVQGFKTRFSLYTVPGQVEYNASRKLILNGVDGIIFVADSDVMRSKDNGESLQNMAIERMERELNPTGVPSFEAVASEGLGVFATLKAISKLILNRLQ